MSAIELLDLPNEILGKILSYIPDHFIVASVCQKFYDIDCLNYSNNLEMCLKFSEYNKELPLQFQSVSASRRVFRSIDISFEFEKLKEFGILKKILLQHGSSVKNLKLRAELKGGRKFKLSSKTLIGLLELFPKLEKLDISINNIELFEQISATPENLPFLPKLKELAFDSRMTKFFTKHLPLNIKIIDCFDGDMIYDEEAVSNLLKALELMKFEKIRLTNAFCRSEWPALEKLLRSQQTNLKSLQVVTDEYNDFEFELFDECAKMEQLEHLTIDEINEDFLENFPEMNIKSLKMYSFGYFLDEFCLLGSKSLEKISFPLSDLGRVDLGLVGRNFPLKFLRIDLKDRKVNEVLNEFKLLESLELEKGANMYNELYVPSIFDYDEDQIYTNLKYLSIIGSFKLKIYDNDFLCMLKALPNLEKLHAVNILNFQRKNFFGHLKTRLSKLQELYLSLILKTASNNSYHNDIYYDDSNWPDSDDSSSSDESDQETSSDSSSSENDYDLDNPNLEKPILWNDESIKALQDLSNDEKLISFYCQIEGVPQKLFKKVDELQGYFRISVEQFGDLILKKGKFIDISIPDEEQ